MEHSRKKSPAIIAIKSLIIANTSAFGKRPEKPILERNIETSILVVEKTEALRVKGPVTSRKAGYLVLKILADISKPLGRKEIIEKARELVELKEEDLKKTKIPRKREGRTATKNS